MSFFQFVGAALGAGLMIAITSLVWPRITKDPRPDSLTKVRDVVLTTEVGKNAAQTLGVTNESTVEPVSIATLVVDGAASALQGVAKTAGHTVTAQLVGSLAKQFDSLPEDEKETFRSQICQPSSSSASRNQ